MTGQSSLAEQLPTDIAYAIIESNHANRTT